MHDEAIRSIQGKIVRSEEPLNPLAEAKVQLCIGH